MQLVFRNARYSLKTSSSEVQQNKTRLTYRGNHYFATSSSGRSVEPTMSRQLVYRGVSYSCCF